jgi:REP element-mobilizing transposase RayT
MRRQLWEIIGRREELKIVEGHLMGDHVHMCLNIPPQYAVVNVIRCIKGKSATQIARTFGGRRRNFTAETFGHAFSYFVSTVGLGENMFRAYIRKPRGRGRAVRADEVWNLHSPPRAAHAFMAPLGRLPNKPPALPGLYLTEGNNWRSGLDPQTTGGQINRPPADRCAIPGRLPARQMPAVQPAAAAQKRSALQQVAAAYASLSA